ncbi:peptidase U62 modulator of DNA gyrase [Denitrovibrio acetiphilus DSM 12809]|uniref:Peptidase U62 modulator of DNA gyrase n=1 Tax=Denitrovibrio acetiphilus (strain DSM 12809 / NBRC 114555 / N2460) TaxID=522772 RepID=D4H829_DENA2|nr:metallopeptidase TldD-related protein [Denitrovibrio acetiphilus]ADD68178.1 peptidase U62 modulator of DNA gyrase [Denitrovibrio acetiphilus DSM 12809]
MINEIENIINRFNSSYDDISIHIQSGRSKSVQLNGYETETVDYAVDTKLIARAVKDGRVVSCGFTGADAGTVADFLDSYKVAINSLPADEFRFIPDYSATEGDLDVCDPAFDTVTLSDLTDIAKEITSAATAADKRVKAVKQSAVDASFSETVIISTAGPVVSRSKTFFSAVAYLIAEEGGEERDAYDQISVTKLGALSHKLVGEYAAENACSLLGAKSISTGSYNILFSASVMADFMELLLELINGESVYKGTSMLTGKLGSKCASDNFTMIDNPLLRTGLGSRIFDDEGQASGSVSIFQNGILQNYLHNSYTAKALDMTNNARGAIGNGGNISVTSTNVLLAPSTAEKTPDAEDYLKITEVMGMHTADPISGDFSVGVSGILYKNGTSVHPFKEAVLSGNLADLLSGTIEVFDNSRTFGNITASDTLFDKMTVSGV